MTPSERLPASSAETPICRAHLSPRRDAEEPAVCERAFSLGLYPCDFAPASSAETPDKLVREFWHAVAEWENKNMRNNKVPPAELSAAYERAHTASEAVKAALTASAAASSTPRSAEPTDERAIDDLLEAFQDACEDVAETGERGPGATRAKDRAVLRNDLRAKLLSVAALAADRGRLAQEYDLLTRAVNHSADCLPTCTADGCAEDCPRWNTARWLTDQQAEIDRLAQELADARLTAKYESDVARQAVDSRDRLQTERDEAIKRAVAANGFEARAEDALDRLAVVVRLAGWDTPNDVADAVVRRVEALEAGLKVIAALSDKPDDYEWYDDFGDYADIDRSNMGDVHDHGCDMTRWAIAKRARAALTPETPNG